MKLQIYLALIFLLLIGVLAGVHNHSALPEISNASVQNRLIQFEIVTVEENDGGVRKIISETTVEGLPGTDFNINLQTKTFKLRADFVSDLTADDKLNLKAKLDTRRLYGYSERQMPLYEEDAQNHALQVGFEEKVVLLPFGRSGGQETLKIEITQKLIDTSDSKIKDRQPLKINIAKPDANGEINVEAFKIPHKFEVETVLLADGEEIARSTSECRILESQKIVLQPASKSDPPEIARQPFAIKLMVDSVTRSRPSDLVGIKFDFSRTGFNTDSGDEKIISNGAGVSPFDKELDYHLNSYIEGDKKYELKFIIHPAKGEGLD